MRRPLCLALLLLAGCTADEAPLPTATDDLGRAVELTLPAERVLTLAPNLTELLFAAGGGHALVGASQADDYPPGIGALPRFGTYPLDVEAVVALRPDLVLATAEVNNPDDARPLAEVGIPTYFFSFDTVADVPRALRTAGALVGTEAEAAAAAEAFGAAMREISNETEGRARLRTLLLIGDETLFAYGGASYTQELIEIAGGESVTAHFDGEAVTLSEEFVLEAAPEVIVGGWGADYDVGRFLALHPALSAVPAVAARRVYSLDPDLLLRPGPRLVEGAAALARVLQGGRGEGRAPGPDMARHVPKVFAPTVSPSHRPPSTGPLR